MEHSVLNVKALVGAFNQEKALVGAFSVIVQPVVEPMDRFTALVWAGTLSYCSDNDVGRYGHRQGGVLWSLVNMRSPPSNGSHYANQTWRVQMMVDLVMIIRCLVGRDPLLNLPSLSES